MALRLVAPPAAEPVTGVDLKSYLRVDPGFTADDALLGSLAAAAREWCEVHCQRRFVRQTWQLSMDFFPGYVDFKLTGQKVSSPFVSGSNAVLVGIRYAILLPYPPIAHIVSFTYQDENGNSTSMAAGTDYIQDLLSQPARLMPLFGQMWPVARVVANAVQVEYVAGYGGYVTVGTTENSAALSGEVFTQDDVGLPIQIPGAAANANTLSTTLVAVDNSGVGTMAAPAAATVPGAQAYIGQPVPDAVLTAIKALASHWYERRQQDDSNIPFSVKAMLSPYRDLRL